MSGKKAMRGMAGRVRDWVEEILGFLLKASLPPGSVRLADAAAPAACPEVGLVVQFWGEEEGEIVLLASRATAGAFADRFGRGARPAPGSREELRLIKGSLGEVLNILSAKLLSTFPGRLRPQRQTTPSCIFGKELLIIPEGDETASVAVETPFGRLDFHLRLAP